MSITVLQSICLWPNLQNPPLATSHYFRVSWKAVIAWSLAFKQRQIEGWSLWKIWPILCVLQLCFWFEGSRPVIMKM